MNSQKFLNQKRNRRKRRSRAKIFGTADKPRLSIFRSHRFIYAQLIDDEKSRTLLGASSRELKEKKSKSEKAAMVGKLLAEKAMKAGIKKAVFSRGAYKYHGRIKALAEAARKAGLKI